MAVAKEELFPCRDIRKSLIENANVDIQAFKSQSKKKITRFIATTLQTIYKLPPRTMSAIPKWLQ